MENSTTATTDNGNKATTTTATNVVPIIDLSTFSETDLESRRAIGRRIVQVSHDLGFCYLRNHGLSTTTSDGDGDGDDAGTEAFAWTRKFYALPDDQKRTAERPQGSNSFLGWHGLGNLVIEKGGRDVVDQFSFSSDHDTSDPSRWVSEADLPGFHGWAQRFYGRCWTLADKVMRALSLGLELEDEKFLSRVHDPDQQQVALKYYPAVPRAKLHDGSLRRLGAHTDFDSFTLLLQDDEGGLEVESPEREGEFVAVPPIEGTVVMNIGELLTMWTNGYLKLTRHCVGPPKSARAHDQQNNHVILNGAPESDMTRDRYSIPFFIKPRWDAVLETMPGFVQSSSSKRYVPTTFQELYNKRVSQTMNSEVKG